MITRPPRSTPFPYTTLFRSLRTPTQGGIQATVAACLRQSAFFVIQTTDPAGAYWRLHRASADPLWIPDHRTTELQSLAPRVFGLLLAKHDGAPGSDPPCRRV